MSIEKSGLSEKSKYSFSLEPVKMAYKKIMDKYDNPKLLHGLQTGFVDLDQWLSGLHSGDLILITGEPAVGKTVLSSNIACHAVITQSRSVLYFTLELSSDRLILRMLIATGKMNCLDIYSGKLADDDFSRLTVTVKLLTNNKNLFVVDSMHSIAEMISHAKLLNETKPLGLVVIDYLQLVRELINAEADSSIVANLLAKLKSMATELSVPVIVISNPMLVNGHSANNQHESFKSIPHIDVHLNMTNQDVASPNMDNLCVTTIEIIRARNAKSGKFSILLLKEFLRFDNLIDDNDFIWGNDCV